MILLGGDEVNFDVCDEFLTPVFKNGSHGLSHNLFGYPIEGKIWETFVGGETWTQVMTNIPLYRISLAYVPGTENTWVNTGGNREQLGKGASVSYDGGHTWGFCPGTEGAKFRKWPG